MLTKHIKLTPIDTKTKGTHIKLYYSESGNVNRISTGIFLDLNRKQINYVKNGVIKHNWFRKGDYENLSCLIEKYDTTIDQFIQRKKRKPSYKELQISLDGPQMDGNIKVSSELTFLMTSYIEHKQEVLNSIGISPIKIRKKLERYKTMSKVIEHYCREVINQKIDLSDMIDDIFWDRFISFLLFEKPRTFDGHEKNDSHELSEQFGKSVFEQGIGLSNNTLLKWLGDFNTMLNHYKTHSSYGYLIEQVKRAESTSLKKLSVKEYDNENPVLRKKEFDILKSQEFEDQIKDDMLDSKRISRESLVKIKDSFVAMIILGCRYSDFIELELSDIINKKDTANKTSSKYNLNINDTLCDILEKYDFNFKMSNQKFNPRLQVLMKQFYDFIIEKKLISERELLFVHDTHRGRFSQRTVYKKHQLIGAHTARRSFASISYYDLRIDKKIIMKYTGHTSEKEFDKYINLVVDEDTSKEIAVGFN